MVDPITAADFAAGIVPLVATGIQMIERLPDHKLRCNEAPRASSPFTHNLNSKSCRGKGLTRGAEKYFSMV